MGHGRLEAAPYQEEEWHEEWRQEVHAPAHEARHRIPPQALQAWAECMSKHLEP